MKDSSCLLGNKQTFDFISEIGINFKSVLINETFAMFRFKEGEPVFCGYVFAAIVLFPFIGSMNFWWWSM